MKSTKKPSGKTTGRVRAAKTKTTCPLCGATFTAPAAIHAQFCPGKKANGPCGHCGSEEGEFHECRYCGKVVCEDCQEPDLHNCGDDN